MNLKDLKTKEEVFDALRIYLVEQIKLARREAEHKDSFNRPAWAEYQACQIGTIRAFKKLYELIPDQGQK